MRQRKSPSRSGDLKVYLHLIGAIRADTVKIAAGGAMILQDAPRAQPNGTKRAAFGAFARDFVEYQEVADFRFNWSGAVPFNRFCH